MKSKKLHILAATLFLSGIANAQFITDERVISFENGTSTENVSASKGNFFLSGEHYKDGKSSLKWNYRGKEDYLSIKKDLKFELKSFLESILCLDLL